MLRPRLEQALKEAVVARNPCAVATLRLVLAALKDRDICERNRGNLAGLTEAQEQAILAAMIKQRRDSIQAFEQENRPDLAQREAEEIVVIEAFLPQQMTADEIAAAVDHAIEETGAQGLKDMSRVMAALKERHAGCMDFARASVLLKERLG
jgi:hypothetical protein